MRPVVFDLDQTLIRGEAVDWALWLAAASKAIDVTVSAEEDWAGHPVHTDHGLLESLSQRHRGRSFVPEERRIYETEFLATLDAAVATHPEAFPVMPGAPALLDALAGRACLATGNFHAVTVRKLLASGLQRPWMPCSCSEDAPDRASLVAGALQAIGWRPGLPATSFGDGVWDVRAARVLGVGFIGVAQEEAHVRRLREAGATCIVADYRDPELMRMIEDAAVP